jgi:CheY-like chemotaxis protein
VAHVLIVDDDADIRLSMRMMLEDIGGHTVLEAADGESGLALLRASEEPLVVLLDLLMPGLDGIGVLQAVAADERLAIRHAYVVVTVSRRARSGDLPESLGVALQVVPKPFDMNVLLDTVTQADEHIHDHDQASRRAMK